jgi:hypothetical protein
VKEMGTKSLRQMMLNKLDMNKDIKGYGESIAKLAGYSTIGGFVKALKKEDGDIEKFDGFVRVVHEMFPENKFELMTNFAETLNPQTLTARFMLEYATIYKLFDLKDYLIEQLKNASNVESNQWAFAYETLRKFNKKEIGGFEAVNSLSQIKYTKPEMKVFSKIVQFYCFYELRNTNMMDALYQDIKNDIESIKKKFVKDSFYARLFLIECSVSLHNKSISDLREKLFLMESALDPVKALAYLQIGNSYIINNYEKANKYYLLANEYASGILKNEVRKSINFNNILWDKFEGYLEDGDNSNKLFYYAKKGQLESGRKLLETMDVESLSDYRKGFNYYYQGLLFNDKNMFYKSVEHFNKCNEKFYKKLPLLELEKVGENIHIINALSA